VEGKTPRAFNPNKPSKSRGSDLGYASDIDYLNFEAVLKGSD